MPENVLYTFHANHAIVFDCMGDCLPIIVALGFIYVAFFDPEQELGAAKPFLRAFTILASPLIIIISCLALYDGVKEAYLYEELLNSDKVYTVSGFVENYHCPPFTGHDSEHFDIDGIHFEYSFYEFKNGYHKPASNGGVVKHDGQHLMIKYIERTFDEDDETVIIYPGDGIEGEFPEGENIILYIAEIKDQ